LAAQLHTRPYGPLVARSESAFWVGDRVLAQFVEWRPDGDVK
jgi:hypothetical protein